MTIPSTVWQHPILLHYRAEGKGRWGQDESNKGYDGCSYSKLPLNKGTCFRMNVEKEQ